MVNNTKRRRERERKKRKDAIKRAALELFSQRGYTKATAAEIAKLTGLSKGLIYYYFDSKQQIFEEILQDAFSDLLSKLEKIKISNKEPIKKLEAFIETEVRFYKRNKKIHSLITSLMTGPLLKEHEYTYVELFKEKHREEGKILEDILKEGLEKGVYREIDIRFATVAIGGIFHSALPVLDLPVKELSQKIVDFVLMGLLGGKYEDNKMGG